MKSLVPKIADALLARRCTLATAESCTGGMIGAALTDLSGSSAWYLGGVIAYANSVKMKLLHVPEATLDAHGAVSPETARAMAQGIAQAVGADCAIAVTGIAGPTGGTPEKPVGLVYIATTTPTGINVQAYHFDGSRAAIRSTATRAACQQLLDHLHSPPATT